MKLLWTQSHKFIDIVKSSMFDDSCLLCAGNYYSSINLIYLSDIFIWYFHMVNYFGLEALLYAEFLLDEAI